MPLVPEPTNCDISVKRAIQGLSKKLGYTASPVFVSTTFTNLTANSLIGTNAGKLLESVTIGTGLDYTRPTLSLSHLGIEALTDPGVDKILFWDDSATACKWLGMGNSVAITATTLDTIQDIRTTASPTFAGLTLTNAAVIGSNSVVFQPNADSTTFFRINDEDGNIIFGIDTVNNSVGIRTAPSTTNPFKILQTSGVTGMDFESTSGASTAGLSVKSANNIIFNFNKGALNRFCYIRFHRRGNESWYFGTTDSDIAGLDGDEFYIGRTVAPDFLIERNGNIGIGGETAPETLTEWTHTQPYLTLHNSTHEDTDGGRESRINFKGEQSGGEETTLARIEVSHDGGVDDQLGKIIASVNTGAGLAQALEIGSDLLATFAGSIVSANYTAANLLTACANNAGALNFSAASKTLTVEDNAVVSQDYSVDASPTFAGLNLTGNVSLSSGASWILLHDNGTNVGHYLLSCDTTESSGYGEFSIWRCAGSVDACTLGDNPPILWADSSLNIYFPKNLTVNTNTLFVDSVNNKIGVGTITPDRKFVVEEDGSDGVFIRSASENYSSLGFGVHTGYGWTYIQSKNSAGVTLPLNFFVGSISGGYDMSILEDGGILMPNLKSGTNQANAGAAANELYHDTDDNTIKIGV